MKHQLPAFLTGVAVTAMVFTCAPAIAAQIQIITASVNTVNIALNGKQVAAKGENYILANGTQVPYSLSFSGTTYLPIRKVGELVGQEIYWDGKTGTAGVGVNSAKAPETDAYSTWTAEEEKAYQEFKGMWRITLDEKPNSSFVNLNGYDVEKPDVEQTIDNFLKKNKITVIEKCCVRFDSELYVLYGKEKISYHFMLKNGWGWMDTFDSGVWNCGYKQFSIQ